MKRPAKVKEMVEAYEKDHIRGLNNYFNNKDIYVTEGSFLWRISEWLKMESYKSVKLELETLILKLNNYDNKERDSEEDRQSEA